MTKEQIITDLEVIIEDFKAHSNGCYPLALSEAVAIIKEIAIIEKLPEKEKGGKQ